MKKETLPKPQKPLITELAFRLILDSEETEGFKFNMTTVDAGGVSRMINIDKKVVLGFLYDEYTKVSVKRDPVNGFMYLVASNSISNESIKISGLADHYLALLQVVDRASRMKKMIAKNPKQPILSEDIITDINQSLQSRKFGEIGIGEYREFDFLGNPVEMCVTTIIEGERRPILSVPLCKARDVRSEMDKLIEFGNSIPSRAAKGEDVMKLIAMFHAKFIQIHPFRDGNGRTGRLLTNYLLLSLGKQIVSIPIEDKNEYVQALNYANSDDVMKSTQDIARFPSFLISKYHQLNSDNPNATNQEIFEFMACYRTEENKYDFLIESLKKHQISISSRSVFANILNNYGQKNIDTHIDIGSISADQIDFENLP